MSEDVNVAEADPVDSLPEEQMDFTSALDAAFAKLEAPQDPEPQEEEKEEVAEVAEENEEVTTEESSEESGEEKEVKEESEEDLESFDPTDELDAEVGDDWTPKAAARFKQLKAELKAVTSELETLRQESSEKDSKVKELSGEVDRNDIEALQEKLAE